MNGEKVGLWHLESSGDVLTYDEGWLNSARTRPLSLSLPFTPGNFPHRGQVVRNWFDNLLPDSQNVRERLARRFRASGTGAFDLLAEIGRDCVGALQVLPPDEAPDNLRTVQAESLDEAAVARLLRATVAGLTGAGGQDGAEDLRISIAGAQEKTALLWHQGSWWRPYGATPTTHILKLPLGRVGNMQLDLRDSVDNEWLCSLLLDAYGIPVAPCRPLVFEDQRVLAVERFDRVWRAGGQWLLRLPQEDFCQATGAPSHLKYESDGGPGMDRILEILASSRRRELDRETFLRAQLLFWLLCAPDGHAKNFSIALHAGAAFSLAPLYDVMSAYPVLGEGPNRISAHRVRMAMAVRSRNAHWRMRDILRRDWQALGRRNGIVTTDGKTVDAVIDELAARTPSVIDKVSGQLPGDFPAYLADCIFEGLREAARRLGETA